MKNQYQEFKTRFKKMGDNELLAAYENDRGKCVGITAHIDFLRALREEFEDRDYEYPKLVKKLQAKNI